MFKRESVRLADSSGKNDHTIEKELVYTRALFGTGARK